MGMDEKIIFLQGSNRSNNWERQFCLVETGRKSEQDHFIPKDQKSSLTVKVQGWIEELKKNYNGSCKKQEKELHRDKLAKQKCF